VPESFDPAAKPWIQPDQGAAEALADAVNRCPSGALSMKYADGTSAMVFPDLNTCDVTRDGPYYLRGNLVLKQWDEVVARDTRMALCRCGASQNKPFCDNSHKNTGFAHSGALRFSKGAPPAIDLTAPLMLRQSPNGPMQCTGPLTLRDTAGQSAFAITTILCRCGGSQNKPYCDGTHKKIGFIA
jgi:CDGSH-type Zn-finger protein